MTHVADEVLGKIARQQADLFRRVREGSLDPDIASRGIQAIMEGKIRPQDLGLAARHGYGSSFPSWYIDSDQQHVRVLQLITDHPEWGFKRSDVPDIPDGLKFDLNEGEMMLLCVYLRNKRKLTGLQRTFDELWSCIDAPDGHAKRTEDLESDPQHLRVVLGESYKPGIRWVIFSPKTYQGVTPIAAMHDSGRSSIQFAGLEVLMAMVLFPDWVGTWNGGSSPYPYMLGLQCCLHSTWAYVPCLSRLGNTHRQLLLASVRVDYLGLDSGSCASPTFREVPN